MQFVSLTSETADEFKAVQQFTEEHKIPWPVGYGADRTLDALQVTGIPTTFVVGRDGKIVWNDEVDGSFESAVEEALSAPTGT